MIKKRTLRTIILSFVFLTLVTGLTSFLYINFFSSIDTSEIDLYYDLLTKEGQRSPDLILDLGVGDSDDLQTAVDRIKKAMALKDYDIWVSLHAGETPPAYIERKGPFLTIYFSTHVKLLREKINVLVHEIGHVYVWGLKGGIPKGYDEEKIVDCSGVFLGLGIPVLNGFTDITTFSGTGEYRTEKKFYGYLTPDEFGYLLARYCQENGIDKGNAAAFLNSSGKKYFARGCNYLSRRASLPVKDDAQKTGAFWCPKCGHFNRVDISIKIDGIRCENCAWEKKWGFGEGVCFESLSVLDRKVFFFLNDKMSCPIADSAIRFFMKVPGRYIIIPGFFLLLFSRRKYLKNTAMIMLSSIAVTGFAYETIKFAIKRPRPFLALENVRLVVGAYQGYSFPSGHAAIIFCIATVMAMRYPNLKYPALAMAVIVSLSRVYLGLHYPSDVIAGGILGVSIAYFVAASGNVLETGKKRTGKGK